MIKFLKYTLATFAGGIIAGIVLFFIGFGILMGIAGLAAAGDKEAKIEENTILLLELNGPIVERSTDDPFAEAFASISGTPTPEGLNRILSNIKKAKRDENITGIVLESGLMSAGYATIEEIRNALIDFKESEKFIYSFAPIYTQKAYYLASVADKIYLNPGGMLEFKGLFAQRMFFKGTLEKLGVEMQVFKHGEFKSAVEPFLLEKMSDPARLQTETYLNSMWGHLVGKIAEARGLSADELKTVADKMPMFRNQDELIESGLVDGLKYKDEVIAELKELTETEESDDLKAVKNSKYGKVYVPKETKGLIRDKIAVIYAEGEIDGADRNQGINSEKISKAIRKARRDSSIKAIVFRVNSPGGSALGSEIIWREVKLAQETKPFIVSMGDLAASGGYYISCEADAIFAHPTTLTGSIGIFGMIPNTQGLMKKIGLTFDGVKTNEFADMPSLNRPFRKEERALLQAYIEMGYDNFVTRCADGRKTSKEAIGKVAEGRVWSGQNALDINLVDKLGGINDALALAQEKAGLEKYRVIELPEIPDPFEQFIKELTGEARMFVGKSIMGEEYEYLHTLENLKNGHQVQARMPYNIEVY
ncbi:MAG: signal peptide peptidase SppA [Marinilabiliaceae bacterium]|nr:signal peptide peptidase SppA [Marinilabiliaceae bacterium]